MCAGSRAAELFSAGSRDFGPLVEKWFNHTQRTARFETNLNKSEILIYGPIGQDFFGDGVTAKWFKSALDKFDKSVEITVRIDSPGGLISEGSAIYNLLVQAKQQINIVVDGFAASAASFIAMAGDNIAIGEGSYFMIHDARGVVYGTAQDMRKEAIILESMSSSIADRYVARTGIGKKKILEWMQDETWFTGGEAVSQGFADELILNKSKTQTSSVASAYADAFAKFPVARMPNRVRAARLLADINI